MTSSDKRALKRLTGGSGSQGVSTDDLQGLLLQVVFALLMVFMLAYFMFVEMAKKKQEEQLLELNHQKLVLAIEKTIENHRVKYGLNALMTQGTDGKRTFNADDHIRSGKLDLSPAAKASFASGSTAVLADYADVPALEDAWESAVISTAELTKGEIVESEQKWLRKEIKTVVENMRLDARGVQRALAARLQEAMADHPEVLGDVRDAAAIAAEIKVKSLEQIKEALGTEVLP